ncbi:uncharacterized protein LOC116139117 [Pistacia vera]|uniref:uncharacterized protein LOC116139117 n=1 Tax=Pistacia vera TaxID=55513 RepID=UPI0012633A6B|nr:uncharacterized protein LOC116139117 [Pistacia vera]
MGREIFEKNQLTILVDAVGCGIMRYLESIDQNKLSKTANLKFLEVYGCKHDEKVPGLEVLDLILVCCLPTGDWVDIDFVDTDFVDIDFDNCYKLKLHAKDLLNIQRDAVLWFHSKERKKRYVHDSYVRGTIFYPGSEISDWFDLVSNENFIKLPTGCLNDNVIGFALCVVLSSPCKSLDLEYCNFTVHFDLFVDEKLVSQGLLRSANATLYASKSDLDYVIIGFEYIVLSELLPLSSNSEARVEFLLKDYFSSPYKLKKCGARLLYVEDNDLRTDARVDRDQRLKSINGSDE